MAKKTRKNSNLYLVKPEVKPGLACPVPKDAKPSECQKAYYVRKYLKLHSVHAGLEKQEWLKSILLR